MPRPIPPVLRTAEELARLHFDYEHRLQRDPGWAMAESTRFFEGKSGLHATLRELVRKLDEMGVNYAVIGGMALTAHGYARMTEDINLLVTRADLKKIHAKLVGLGYKREFEGSKNIRDTTTLVKIEFVLTGDYPGSGKPQPVSFPSPADADPIDCDGVKFIGLDRLVELKLASGMTGGAHRARDLVDVQQLITALDLPRDFSARIHEYVRDEYEDLWDAHRATQRKYVRVWRNKFLTLDAKSLDEMIATLEGAVEELKQARLVLRAPLGGAGHPTATNMVAVVVHRPTSLVDGVMLRPPPRVSSDLPASSKCSLAAPRL